MNDAEKLFFTGGGHARAAHALIVAANANVHMNVPFYLLVGFALETILKAAYLHLGGGMGGMGSQKVRSAIACPRRWLTLRSEDSNLRMNRLLGS